MEYITTEKHPELKEGIIISEIERKNGTTFKTAKGWGTYDHLDMSRLVEKGYIKELQPVEFTKSDLIAVIDFNNAGRVAFSSIEIVDGFLEQRNK